MGMAVIKQGDKFFITGSGEPAFPGPFDSDEAAWREIDRRENSLSPAERRSDYVWGQIVDALTKR